jgi:tetratricopeptide (TPR) repeat protein
MLARRAVAAFLVVLAFLALGGTADAADETTADVPALVERGVALRKVGRDAEALELFRQAFAADRAPAILAQIGLAEQALGRYVAAETDLKAALSRADDSWIARNRASLEGALAVTATHLADIDVTTNVSGAELWINGARAASLPAPPVRTAAGLAVIEVRAPGYEALRRTIELAPGARFREEMPLVPLAQASPCPAEPGRPEATSASPVQAEPATRGGSTRRTLAWSLVAAGGVALAGGLVAQGIRESNASVYDDDALCFFGALTRDQRCGRYRSAAEQAQVFAIVGYTLAGVALSTAAILFATAAPNPPQRKAQAILTCNGLPPVALSCAAKF